MAHEQTRTEWLREQFVKSATGEIAAWMVMRGYATGHGDTIEDLLAELVGQCRPAAQKPVAFRVQNGNGRWVVSQDEKEARDIAEALGIDYHGLYARNPE